VPEERVPAVIVELPGRAMRHLVRQEIQQPHWAVAAAQCLAAEKQPVRATSRRALFVLQA